MDFDREIYLKEQFNDFWSQMLGEKKDYFSHMAGEDMHLLKAALSNINNIITYNATIGFVEYISRQFDIDEKEKEKLLSLVKSSKPNDNGYDIEYIGTVSIVAEIKCNRPINGKNRFGAAQKNGITKDIRALLDGKSKSALTKVQMTDFYKFMVIYRFDDKTDEAVENYIKNLPVDLAGRVVLGNTTTELTKNKVFVVLHEL